MMTIVPSRAFFTPPETGASTRVISHSDKTCASSRVRKGSHELISITMVPGLRVGTIPGEDSLPRITAETSSELGSMVMTTSAPCTASVAVAAGAAGKLLTKCPKNTPVEIKYGYLVVPLCQPSGKGGSSSSRGRYKRYDRASFRYPLLSPPHFLEKYLSSH